MSGDAEQQLVDTLAEIWIAIRQRRAAKAATEPGPPTVPHGR